MEAVGHPGWLVVHCARSLTIRISCRAGIGAFMPPTRLFPSYLDFGRARKKIHDLSKRPQGPQMLGLYDRSVRKPFLQSRKNLHPLDGVNAQVGIQLHVQLQHLGRIARLLSNDVQQDLPKAAAFRWSPFWAERPVRWKTGILF